MFYKYFNATRRDCNQDRFLMTQIPSCW